MKFKVSAIDSDNKPINITEEAANEQELIKKLVSKKIYPSKIELSEQTPVKSSPFTDKKSGHYKIKKNDLKYFAYQMKLMLKAGVPLDYAVDNLKKYRFSGDMNLIVSELHKSILSGISISNFMEKYESVFPHYYIGLTKSGELIGKLGDSFGKIYSILEQELSLKKKIISIMVYPALLIFLSVVFFIFMISYILPNITSVFDELNAELPILTKFVINFSTWFNDNIILIILLFVLFFVILNKIMKIKFFVFFVEKLKLKIPGIKKIYLNYLLINFTDIISSLLSNNAPFLTSIEVALKSPGSLILSSYSDKIMKNIKSGKSLASSLEETKFFPDLFIKLTDTGEKTKNLPEIFLNLNFMYKEELETDLKTFTSIIEPVIMTIIGVIITFMILSVITPIMKLRT